MKLCLHVQWGRNLFLMLFGSINFLLNYFSLFLLFSFSLLISEPSLLVIHVSFLTMRQTFESLFDLFSSFIFEIKLFSEKYFISLIKKQFLEINLF